MLGSTKDDTVFIFSAALRVKASPPAGHLQLQMPIKIRLKNMGMGIKDHQKDLVEDFQPNAGLDGGDPPV